MVRIKKRAKLICIKQRKEFSLVECIDQREERKLKEFQTIDKNYCLQRTGFKSFDKSSFLSGKIKDETSLSKNKTSRGQERLSSFERR